MSITILINDAPPSSINYSPSSSVLTKGTIMGNVTPTYSGGTPTLGQLLRTCLQVCHSTPSGEIGGTPTAVSPLTVYTITATNAGGSGTTTIPFR